MKSITRVLFERELIKQLKKGAIFYRRCHPEELAEKITKFLNGEIKIDNSKTKKRIFSQEPLEKITKFYKDVIKSKRIFANTLIK